MTNQENRSKAAADLRQKAEALAGEQAARTPEESAAFSPGEIRKTLHELRVHQIELEMQNEELRTAQAQIEAGRARYFDLYDLAPVGYCTLSGQGLILEANLTAATLLGTTRGALVKQPISRFIHKDDQDICYLHRKQLFETGEPQESELRLVKPDGALFWAHLTANAAQAEDGSPVCRMTLSDITERKRAAEELLNASQRLSKVGGWGWDVETQTMWWTKETYRIHDFTPGEMELGSTEHINRSAECYEPEDRPVILAAFQRCVEVGQPYDLEFPFTTAKGRRLWIRTTARPERARGKVIRVIGNIMDITERKRAEEQLQASLVDLELAQRIAHVGNWFLDPAEGVPVWSDEVYRIYERDPAMGPPAVADYKKMYAPDQYAIFLGAMQSAITEGKPYDIRLNLTLPTGNKKWVHALCQPDPTPGPAGHFLRGTIQDITEIKRAEEKIQEYSERLEEMVAERTRELEKAQDELLQKERLAVLGHFAGSMSHEIRNPLAAIDSAAYYLKLKLAGREEKLDRHLGRIQGNVKKATDIIKSLLSLARMEKPKTRHCVLADLITETVLSGKIPESVEVVKKMPADTVWLDVDAEQIRMALKNIIRNAVQAMDESGTLTVSARPSGSGTIDISVTDTGPGIAADPIEKVFEPLFSTKTHGIGFGLSITKMIVENHGGAVRVESPAAGGARFVMTFPQARPARF